MKITTFLNYQPDPGEINLSPTMTVPDQSMAIREIMSRFSRGLPVGGQRVALFTEEGEEMPDPRTLDLTDLQEIAEYQQEVVNNFKKSQNAKETAAATRRAAEKLLKERSEGEPAAK